VSAEVELPMLEGREGSVEALKAWKKRNEKKISFSSRLGDSVG